MLKQKSDSYDNLLFQATEKNYATNPSSHEQALRASIEVVCSCTGWPIGHVYWLHEGNDFLTPTNIWHVPAGINFDPFIEISSKTHFSRGVGLPGRVWNDCANTHWIKNIYKDGNKDGNFDRALCASSLDFRVTGAIGVPIVYEQQCYGVFEFFTPDEIDEIEELIPVLLLLGRQAGLLFHQFTVSDELKINQKHLRLILNSADEGIFGLDYEGRVTFINPAACGILKMNKHDVIGQLIDELIEHSTSDSNTRLPSPIIDALRAGKTHRTSSEMLCLKMGVNIEVAYTCGPIIADNKTIGAVVTFSDIGKRMNATRQINALVNVQQRYIEGASNASVFDGILQYFLDVTQSEYGFIGGIYQDSDGDNYLRTFALTNIAWSEESAAFYEKSKLEGIVFSNKDTLFGQTMATGELLIANSPATHPSSGGLPPGHPPMTSYLGVPIYGATGFIAMVGLANRPGGYTQALVDDIQSAFTAVGSIVESMHHHDMINNMAKYDSLTSLYNRAKLELVLAEQLIKHSQDNTKFAILSIDLNGFKKINDSLGHAVGDKLLAQFARRITICLGDRGVAGRLGGDEFLIILQAIPDIEVVTNVASGVLLSSQQAYEIEGNCVSCDASIGIAIYPDAGSTKEELMKRVDFALYKAKRDKSYQFYTGELEQQYQRKAIIEQGLKVALANDEFKVVFQPQINLKTNKIIGYETLLRWEHSLYGTVSPSEFIPIAELVGLAAQINVWVVKTVLVLLSNAPTAMCGPIKIAINFSPCVNDFVQQLRHLSALIKQSPVNKEVFYFEFELTESGFFEAQHIQDTSEVKQLFSDLQANGVRLAIDDFGVRYSSITRLLYYRFDTIKIDVSFVKALTLKNSDAATAIVKTVLFLANEMHFNVVAEGVETRRQKQILQELGCFIGQGFGCGDFVSANEMLLSHCHLQA